MLRATPVLRLRMLSLGLLALPWGSPLAAQQWRFVASRFLANGQADGGAYQVLGTAYGDFPSASQETLRDITVDGSGRAYATGELRMDGGTVSQFGVFRWTDSGHPDPTFGSGGSVLTAFPGETRAFSEALALAPDGGSVLVAGFIAQLPRPLLAVARYRTADGALDAGFGAGGTRLLDLGQDFYPSRVRLTTVGGATKLLVAGFARAPGEVFAVVRLNDDGTLDASFGAGGVATAKFPGFKSMRSNDLLVDGAGRIILVGAAQNNSANRSPNWDDVVAVARFTPAGTLDPAFGTGGMTTVTLPGAWWLWAGGGVLVSTGRAVARRVPAQVPDSARVRVPPRRPGVPPDSARIRVPAQPPRVQPPESTRVLVPSQGAQPQPPEAAVAAVTVPGQYRIVVSGAGEWPSLDPRYFLIALRDNGALDTGFGTGGSVTIHSPLLRGTLRTAGMVRDTEGRFLFGTGGMRYDDQGRGGERVAVMRVLSNGQLDTGFGSQGEALSLATSMYTDKAYLGWLALDAVGRPVLGGSWTGYR